MFFALLLRLMAKAKAKKKDQPVILITNDDGITAPGIKNLVEAVKGLGEIIVVAPRQAGKLVPPLAAVLT